MMLAVVNRCTEYRIAGRRICPSGMSAELRWQLHDDGIAGGIGEWSGRPNRDGIWRLPCQWGELVELCHLKKRQCVSYVCYYQHQVRMCITHTLISYWAALKYNRCTRAMILGSQVVPLSHISTTLDCKIFLDHCGRKSSHYWRCSFGSTVNGKW